MIEKESNSHRARETERIQEIKTLYEIKSKEKEEEIMRYREQILKLETELNTSKIMSIK